MDMNIEVAERFSSYLTDWDYKHYLLLGGYGSGKSYNTALKIILKLLEEKYEIKEIQPVDMFPYTSHVECCALLYLKF